MKKLTILITVLLVIGCKNGNPPKATEAEENSTRKPKKIFRIADGTFLIGEYEAIPDNLEQMFLGNDQLNNYTPPKYLIQLQKDNLAEIPLPMSWDEKIPPKYTKGSWKFYTTSRFSDLGYLEIEPLNKSDRRNFGTWRIKVLNKDIRPYWHALAELELEIFGSVWDEADDAPYGTAGYEPWEFSYKLKKSNK